MKLILSSFIYIFLIISARANTPDPQTLTDVHASIFKEQDKKYLAFTFENAKGWHTYWRNPGDAGLPITIEIFDGETKLELKPLTHPIPKRYIEEGDILAYGYEGTYSFFYEWDESLNNKTLAFKGKWLICEKVCIPGSKAFNFTTDGNPSTQFYKSTVKVSESTLKIHFNSLPKTIEAPANLDIVLAKGESNNTLVLYYNISANAAPILNMNLLTPFPTKLMTFKHEKMFQDKKGNIFGKMNIDWDGEFEEPEVKLPENGVFSSPLSFKFLFANPNDQTISIIEKEISSFNIAPAQIESFYKILIPVNNQQKKEEEHNIEVNPIQSSEGSQSLFYFILMGLIGGFILNFMPCVLPVISLKLFGLIQHQNSSRAKILKHNLFYTLGVLLTFFALAGIVLILKSTGKSVGWGFQLQSPYFVSAMIVVLFLMALNLFGLFEFITPGGKTLGNVNIRDGFLGDVFSGVLATILSTPCSAPFLGAALTFAFTSSNFTIFSIFMAIGIGLALPFILTGIFPSLIKMLPKPGMWMEHMKKWLGLTLLLTIVWLHDVFTSLIDFNLPVMILHTALITLFFAIYFHKKIAKRKILIPVMYLFPLFFFIYLSQVQMTSATGTSGQSMLLREKNTGPLQWEKWSEEKMKDLKTNGDLVFIDFTAKWCFTCKVNERVVINTSSFKNLVEENNIKLLLGDWTKHDPKISSFLKKNGLVGVPAYFIQKRDGTLINLGETISISEIKKNL